MAISSQGDVIIDLGYCSSAKTIQALLKVVSTLKLMRGQRFYLGVVLDRRRRADALRRIDDAAAEAAALSGVGGSTTKRKVSGH
ncbi:MAG: hypothetical protein IT375_25930 [Polyangiaceae bacterium]|nr:hypothetical protein [Polyangiaceae bacterium]